MDGTVPRTYAEKVVYALQQKNAGLEDENLSSSEEESDWTYLSKSDLEQKLLDLGISDHPPFPSTSKFDKNKCSSLSISSSSYRDFHKNALVWQLFITACIVLR